jgi:hypothetical protein
MLRFLLCLIVAAAFATAPDLAFAFVAPAPTSIPVDILAASTSASADFLVHPANFLVHLSVTSVAVTAPSYTINQWCELRKYSRAEWYRMRARGDGPDTIGTGRMTRVTPAADARWLRKQERKARTESRAA